MKSLINNYISVWNICHLEVQLNKLNNMENFLMTK